MKQTTNVSLLIGVVYLVGHIIFLMVRNENQTFDIVPSIVFMCAVFMGNLGLYLIITSIMNWKAGPAEALATSQNLINLLLEIMILGRMPTFLEICGLIAGIAGAIVIALAKWL